MATMASRIGLPAAYVLLAIVFGGKAIHAQAPNNLTEAEKSAGWMLMFDGKSLAGWHSYRKTNIATGGWAVNDSAIYRRDPGAGSILAPERFAFQDFELSVDWKVPENGNSGVFIRYLESEASENIRTGPETQICGREHSDYEDGRSLRSPGACYAMYPPMREWIKPADQYNTFHVVAYGKRIAHFGNGLKLLEYEIGTPDWQARYDNSKYSSFPLYGDVHSGKLFLQDHGSPVWFRSLKIRPLAQDPWSDPEFTWPDEALPLLPWRGIRAAGRLILRGDGRLRSADPGAAFDLILYDAAGRTRAALRSPESKAGGPPSSVSGFYFIRGRVDGFPVTQSLPIPGP